MLSTFTPAFLAILLISLSSSTLALTLPRLTPRDDSQPRPPISIGASFETYAAHPKLFITPTAPPSESETETTHHDDDEGLAHRPMFQVTRPQFEDILRQTLHIDFRLQVVSDPVNKDKNDDEDENGSEGREVLGEIPVQITIHNLRLGGLSAPQVHSQILNEQRDPVNYSNIRT
ncbi:hypothetical protein BG015_002429 [Linnemannia schmuckeri]|uniref:Uncharacterized protein n=1 Tax=Linnemannia schmuckeri TaxID=64567 RepID=A0A9P5V6B2_9FUNG|nr:hypothetical protein BG015_002429 [Linnemannia schmuckeri]